MKHDWYPEHPAGHAPYCVRPGAHYVSTWCSASEDEPQTLQGKPSLAWAADHPATEEGYEAAHEQHEQAYQHLLAVRAALEEAESALADAEKFLAETEFQPGIPLYTKIKQLTEEHT